ncbi:hypothetical protein [Novipirellula caenicola]|uniref:Uncharacterized protein n=1 Tax=Novipirellula caenicola TaxID=1536901 RepID=A0ABP9VP02_9BACT
MPRFSLLLALLCSTLIVGCDGCRSTPNDEEEEKKKAALPDFTSLPAQAFPADRTPIGGGIKPGHWFSASEILKSNREDVRGQLESRARLGKSSSPDTQAARTALVNVRPIVLPKGQQRRFDYRNLAPLPQGDSKNIFLSSQLFSGGRGLVYDSQPDLFQFLSQEEYFFIILTNRPERFAKLIGADWQRPYRSEAEFASKAANYRIVIPDTDEVLPIAETMLDWTSTAVVLWDDISADALTPGQSTAIADWVHFGGQLIVNGADGSEAIADSSLVDLLPLYPRGNIELAPESATELLQQWAVKSDRSTEAQTALLQSETARVAVDGNLADDAEDVAGTGKLILHRRVGRGRVVQSRFDLMSDWISNWDSYNSFFNAVILQRPRREFVEIDTDLLLKHQYADFERYDADPTMNTTFRIATRDALLDYTPHAATSTDAKSPDANRSEAKRTDAKSTTMLATTDSAAKSIAASPATPTPEADNANGEANKAHSKKRPANDGLSRDRWTRVDPVMGIGGWNNASDAVNLTKAILRNESGIVIPPSSLVVRSLGIYLLALVPLNYLVFRLFGKLEYAWLTVPVIAIAGAVWVARSAQLDIGFARSQTELAILETQPGYQRGHLARVIAIYNSLSSTYDMQFSTVDAVANSIAQSQTNSVDEPLRFQTDFEEGPRLSGVAVGSNQTQMVRAEQIIDLGGGIYLDGETLVNETEYDLLDSFVAVKSAENQIRLAVVGLCAAGSKNKLRFRDDAEVNVSADLPLQISHVMNAFLADKSIPPNSSRLVGRIEESLPGMTVTPQAKQHTAQTVVLANLRFPPSPEPKSDVNLVVDFQKSLTDPADSGSDSESQSEDEDDEEVEEDESES